MSRTTDRQPIMHLWEKYGDRLLVLAILLMTFYAALSLANQFSRLLWDTSWPGAVDLKIRFIEVQAFFSGEPITTPYPPASLVLLWPITGWMSLDAARWVWASAYIVALFWLSSLMIRGSRAVGQKEVIFVVLLMLSMNATGVTIGSGQLGIFILPLLISGFLIILNNPDGRFRTDLFASCLIIAAMIKPTIAAPFFLLTLIAGRLQPALLIVCGYLLLTFFAASFQQASTVDLLHGWINNSVGLAQAPERGNASLHNLITTHDNNLDAFDPADNTSLTNLITGQELPGYTETIDTTGSAVSHTVYLGPIEISLIALSILGAWLYFNRCADIWILLGVTGIFARLWTYHRVYDDVLILLPMITLFRIIKSGTYSVRDKIISGVLLAILMFVNFIPARIHYKWPDPWPGLYSIAHLVPWLFMLLFLVYLAGNRKAAR